MKNIKLTIEYDGTNYSGWQKQNNAVTIQQKLEEAICQVTGKKIEVIGSSRTDAGVHARRFAANFFTESRIPPEKFKKAINAYLPKDIVVRKSEEVSMDFHARFCSKGKTYVYKILNREDPPALGRNYIYFYYGKLDIDKMQKACNYFLGTHDFSAFKKKGSEVKSSVRTIMRLNVEQNENIIKISVTGDGFLYNMVRIIVGTLIDVGSGKTKPEDIESIINSKDRNKAGRSVPPNGLCLEEVYY